MAGMKFARGAISNETLPFRRMLSRNDNTTTAAELGCDAVDTNRTSLVKNVTLYCGPTWDGLSCWPTTAAGTSATVSCFSELNGVQYDPFQNASRECHENGTWADKSDYSTCRPLLLVQEESLLKVLWDGKEASTIYYVGYSLSLFALIAAVSIFLYFKNLRCLRNNIHTNLMATYLMLDLTWIVTATLQPLESAGSTTAQCILMMFLTYLMCTNFFWMFVEGLYLYILAVKTFSIEVVRIHVYGFIGWGLPAVIIVTWASVKVYYSPASKNVLASDGCSWRTTDNYDYIFMCPIIVVLVVNMFFLGQIMWVLITKLRVATSAESKQYRKAAKALLVLIPLLGVTYILVIVAPSHRTASVVFSYIRAVLLSTQGFTVAILYCFLNGEVQKSLRHLWKQLTSRRSLRDSQQYSLSYRSSQYGGSMKLYRSRGAHARGSCISFTTTTSTMSNNCHNCHRMGPD